MNTLSHKRIWSDTGGNFEDPLTFSTGLTRTGDTITNNLSTGIAGGQTVIGGTGSGDTLSYKGTTGNGTSTVSGHTFLVGNNGGTTAMQIFNSGNVNIGNATNTGARILAIGQDTAVAYMGSNVGATSQFAIYGNQVTPSGTNYTITTTSALTVLNNPIEYYYLAMDVPGHANFSNRLTQLWRSPIDGSAAGLATNIEAILGLLPFDVENGYVLNT